MNLELHRFHFFATVESALDEAVGAVRLPVRPVRVLEHVGAAAAHAEQRAGGALVRLPLALLHRRAAVPAPHRSLQAVLGLVLRQGPRGHDLPAPVSAADQALRARVRLVLLGRGRALPQHGPAPQPAGLPPGPRRARGGRVQAGPPALSGGGGGAGGRGALPLGRRGGLFLGRGGLLFLGASGARLLAQEGFGWVNNCWRCWFDHLIIAPVIFFFFGSNANLETAMFGTVLFFSPLRRPAPRYPSAQ
mmetsp:Transcript_22341/g.36126  ORF Transcript_22341/g.36126 Transcript_22341/m.36126 type:complete len:248 (+) Transcript_22341:1643-2386(+)